MLTMYRTPYRRRINRHQLPSDHLAQHVGASQCDIHVPLDVFEGKDAFVITATVPGLNADDLDIEIVENTVSIRGEFKTEAPQEEGHYLRRERPTGTFLRSLRFTTPLDSAKAEARLNQGILTLRIPKVEEALPKTIKVKAR